MGHGITCLWCIANNRWLSQYINCVFILLSFSCMHLWENYAKLFLFCPHFISYTVHDATTIPSINSSLLFAFSNSLEELLIVWIIIEVVDSRSRASYIYVRYVLCASKRNLNPYSNFVTHLSSFHISFHSH